MNLRKHKVVLAIAFMQFAHTLCSQNYSITPNDTIAGEVPFNDLYHFNIELNNLTADDLVFSWEQISLSVPIEWTANLCDNGNCYEGFPLNGTMDTVFAGDYGLMSIGVNPNTTTGNAVVQYAVWEESTPSQIDTLTWFIQAEEHTALTEALNLNHINMYPNPADAFINIKGDFNSVYDFVLTDLSGKVIYSGQTKGYQTIISTCQFPDGIYLLRVIRSGAEIKSIEFIIQH